MTHFVKFNIGDHVIVKYSGDLGKVIDRWRDGGHGQDIYLVRLPGGFTDEHTAEELQDPKER